MNALMQMPGSLWLRYRLMDLRGRGVYADYANEHKCIFIHIPKAAGTSVALSLFGRPSRHIRYLEYEKANAWKFHRYFKFSFVRNPWDRLYSAYRFLKKGGMNEIDKRWAEEHLAAFSDFDAFVKGWVNSENIRRWIHFMPQHYFICDDEMKVKMDFVGRLENLDHDFSCVLQRLSRPNVSLSKVNVAADHKRYQEYYSDEAKDIVSRVYGEDIRVFGYSFDGLLGENSSGSWPAYSKLTKQRRP